MHKLLTSIAFCSFKMKIITKNPHDSFSFSRRYFNLKRKSENEEDDDGEGIVTFSSSSLQHEAAEIEELKLSMHSLSLTNPPKKKKLPLIRVSKLRSLLSFGKTSSNVANLGTKVIVTVFGYSRSRVHLAFQEDLKLNPFFLVEMATPTSVLVREMASGVVRIALECERNKNKRETMFEEKIWRTYCNGKKCGYATSRECGAEERRILDLVGPVSMGAGMLPEVGGRGGGSNGDLMYIRARFERVVGSKESEAFYMINPDRNGRNELSIYLLSV